MDDYDSAAIEAKWRAYWEDNGTFVQANPGDEGFEDKPKMYVLDMFPYPSGAGLHVGHPEGYTATDIVCRYKRMKGFNVLHPMGYDSFGLPAEQYAVEHGVHPRETTAANIANIERQIRMFGFSYDWSRRLATTDVGYYRWTQWIFLKLFNSWYDPEADAARPISELVDKLLTEQFLVDWSLSPVVPTLTDRLPDLLVGCPGGAVRFYELSAEQQRSVIDSQRLAYQAEVPVNWCPKLGTVLANEEVTNEGRSDRGDHPVYRRSLTQWMLRITKYADRLLDDVDKVNWPEPIKIMQRNWIGRSEGADVDFAVAGGGAFEAVANNEFRRVAAIDDDTRPCMTGKTFEGHDPYPPAEPSSPDLMKSIRNLPQVRVPGATYFVTCHAGETSFQPEEREIVFNAMLRCHPNRCVVYAAVVLDDHAHMIVRPLEGHSLSEILQSMKGFSAGQISDHRSASGHVWQDESFDHVIRDTGRLARFVYYVCDSPEEAGLADRYDQYPWLFVNADEVTTEDGEPFGHSLKSRAIKTDETIRVYTTRPDTLFGATYMVLAPEHPLVEQITTDERRVEVRAYVEQASRKSELERIAETKEKTGVDTGGFAINPVNDEKIPIWVADYVMMGYGTGAIMAVPAHDTRDYDFSRTFDLPMRRVVVGAAPPGNCWTHDVDLDHRFVNNMPENHRADYLGIWMGTPSKAPRGVPNYAAPVPGMSPSVQYLFRTENAVHRFMKEELPQVEYEAIPGCFVGDGTAVNSGPYDGLSTADFKNEITEWLEENGLGKAAVNYKLRDWLFSRQRYWGEPFPIVHCDTCGAVGLGEDQLPLELPEMADFSPATSDDPESLPAPPLGKLADWVNTPCPTCGEPAKRELNTMPQWAGSCWYYLRYLDPDNDEAFVDPAIEKYWMAPTESNPTGGVDLYVGGAEHAVLHLLYARFWHKVLYDLGLASSPEPFGRLFNQGMIRSFAYRDQRGVYVGYNDVDTSGDTPRHKQTGEELVESVEKMSKSLKNVVNPDEVIAEYGADAFRLYEMFMGPLEASKPWNTRDVPGQVRFLQRTWRMIAGDGEQPALLGNEPDESVERALHKVVKKVGQDIEAMKFNTAIAAMMEFVNAVFRAGKITPGQAGRFVLILAPLAPHIAEELWQRLGHQDSLACEPWPAYDEAELAEETVELAVQVNGKMRARITVPADASQEEIIAAALADEKVSANIEGKTVVKKIVVPGRLVNLVAK